MINWLAVRIIWSISYIEYYEKVWKTIFIPLIHFIDQPYFFFIIQLGFTIEKIHKFFFKLNRSFIGSF
jgi:hypothetical protein